MRADGDYRAVNAAWGDPHDAPGRPTSEEALRAAKRLYRKWLGHAWPGKWALTSGNRYTWARGNVFRVNPNSWSNLVHFMSHYCHRRLHPGESPHAATHAALEADMIEYVRQQGWLDGKLRPAPREARDPSQVRYESCCQRIARWERKEKRAVNALKKLRRQRAYYEKRLREKETS